jgi:predicted methyltransferase
MKLSKKHQFILFALMKYLKKLNKRFEHQPLEASVSKIDFIKLLQNLNIVEKSQRSLYKNLEILEKKKLIKYQNKFLKLTEKGLKLVQQKDNELYPYIKLIVNIEKGKIETKRAPQTYFK